MSIDDRRLWFGAHRYGYGWKPATWEGWLVLIAYLGLVVVCHVLVARHMLNLPAFFACIAIVTGALVALCWIKGEKPRWRWGGKS